MIGLQAIHETRGNDKKALRFLYMSGAAAERDQTKTPRFMPQYSLMRVSAYVLPFLFFVVRAALPSLFQVC